MAQRNTVARSMHDLGLAAWFGGSLMGAVGVNKAVSQVSDARLRGEAVNAAWATWTPVNVVAIGAHLLGGAQLLKENKGRVGAQKGVKANTGAKLGLTAAALGATAYARILGQRVIDQRAVPVTDGTTPTAATPPEVAKAQKQLKALQWAIPGLTGAMLVSNSLHGEQQRSTEVVKGTLKHLPALLAHSALAHSAAGGFDTAVEGAKGLAAKIPVSK